VVLTKEQILSADDIKTETVLVPEWGGDVIVRGLSGVERDAYEMAVYRPDGKLTNNPRSGFSLRWTRSNSARSPARPWIECLKSRPNSAGSERRTLRKSQKTRKTTRAKVLVKGGP
jgi:hypothetical protein